MGTLQSMPAVLSVRERSALYDALDEVERVMARRYQLLSDELGRMATRHSMIANGAKENV